MTEKIYAFKECLKISGSAQKHLLLGNGFSISLFPKIFNYTSLKDQADFKNNKPVQAIFDALGTSDFEAVLRALDSGKLVANAYGLDDTTIKKIESDINLVRDCLVKAIAGSHPAFPHEISPAQYKSCRAFLRNFSRIYSFNYDLLLYWTTMHNDVDKKHMEADDGFRTSPDNPDAEYVTWEAHNSATIQYLHGALHLFDAGAELRKYTWTRTGVPLMDQIKSALEQGLFPLYVSEGTSESKADRIVHHGYLHRALRSFEAIGGSLFIYGHSLDKNDNHVLRILKRPECKVNTLFVSIHGDQNKPSNQSIVKEARAIETIRTEAKRKLNVYFFDSESAQVWTTPDPDTENGDPKTKDG